MNDDAAGQGPHERPVRPLLLQGGLSNAELTDAWCGKLPMVVPTERDLTAFALGVEVGQASERGRYAPLMQAVEWILEDGHMNQEHLARLRAAWEGT